MSKHIIPALIVAVAILTGGIIGRSTAAIPVADPGVINLAEYQAKMLVQQTQTNLLLAQILEQEKLHSH